MSSTAVTACVLIIGDEILSGRTQDVNLSYIAQALNEHGVQVREARIIPNIEEVIVNTLNECRAKFDYVLTTGGIGPTHDDITADCVAAAFGRELYIHPEIEAIIRRREAPPEIMASRLRMARVPEGAELVRNPTGPHGFQVNNVFVMAGIPRVMQSMLDDVLGRLQGGQPVRSASVTAFVTESQIAGPLGKLQAEFPDVSIGSYPFARDDRYGTSLVVRGTEPELLAKLAERIRTLVVELGGELTDDPRS